MAPVEIESEPSLLPLAAAASHLLLAALCTALCVGLPIRALCTHASAPAAPAAQGTRRRSSRRTVLASLFAALATVSLGAAAYQGFRGARLSYLVWAAGRDTGGGGSRLGRLTLLRRWLADVPVYRDAAEIVAERARRLWWGEQAEAATVVWAVLLAVEGQRKGLPDLWAYLALAHLVSLSFAQSLFYVALVLTPTPLRGDHGRASSSSTSSSSSNSNNSRNSSSSSSSKARHIFQAQPRNWIPHPLLLCASTGLSFGAVLWSGLLADGSSSARFDKVALASRLLTFAPLMLPHVVPASWGTTHAHPREAYRSLTLLYRTMALASFLMHARATALGLAHGPPDDWRHRHSALHLFDLQRRSAWDRTTSAFGRLLGAMGDHPAVAARGWDVIMSTAGLAIWAATRALGSEEMLVSVVPFYGSAGSAAWAASPAGTRRSAGDRRARKAKAGAAAGSSGDAGDADDRPYEPTPAEAAAAVEGDEVPGPGGSDWESAALAWGLVVAGGLGCGSAGVFGGECISG